MALPKELKILLENGVHFGHQAKRWNPKMKKFIYAKRSGIYIINLEKTLAKIKEAKEFLAELLGKGGVILFVGTKKQARSVIKDTAQALSAPYVIERWVGGLLTNFSVVKRRIDKYKQLEEERKAGKFEMILKKELVRLNRILEKMERKFAGVKKLERIPDALFVVDPYRDFLAVKEAKKLSLPVVALVDTDTDPEFIDYPIPANDDTIRSIKVVVSFVFDDLLRAKAQAETDSVEGEVEEGKDEVLNKEESNA